MSPAEYNENARKELRAALVGPRGRKVPANLERDLSRLAVRFSKEKGWRGDIPELARIWSKVISEIALGEKHKKHKGRPLGILTWREKEFAEVAASEVWAVHRAVKDYDAVAAVAAPNPRKRGLTDFRRQIVDRAMALAKEYGYSAERLRIVGEVRKRLRESQEPYDNYLASGPIFPRRTLKKT